MTLIILGGCVLVLAAVLWFARKAGKDNVRAKVAEKGLSNVAKANAAAADPDELERVRRKYERQ
jgi:hypothetical protein